MSHGAVAPSKDIEGVLEGASAERLRAFPASEMRTDARLRRRFISRFGGRGTTSRAEFRAEIEAAYEQMGDAGHFGAELDFGDFFGAAGAGAERGDRDEAFWMYREISEAISEHMKDVDDSYAHYNTEHAMALDGMVDCMGAMGPGSGQRRPCIEYVYGRIIREEYGLDLQYAEALAEMCSGGADRRFLREVRRAGGDDSIYHQTKAILDGACGPREDSAR